MPHANADEPVAPITTFQMPSADDLGFYTKKRLNLYDAQIPDVNGKTSRLSIAAHTNSQLVDILVADNEGTYSDAQALAPMNSLRLTSVLTEPDAMIAASDYLDPVISNLKDPLKFVHNGILGAPSNDDLEFFRKPISDLDPSTKPSQHVDGSAVATSSFATLDNCAASVLTVKKMIAVAMEGPDALDASAGDADYYTQSVRELVQNSARQALIFKGSFEALNLSEIRNEIDTGGSVNGHVYIVTKHHSDVLGPLVTGDELNTGTSSITDGPTIKSTFISAGYDNTTQISPFFVKMNSSNPADRVTHSLYDPSIGEAEHGTRYTVYGTDTALKPSELIGVAVSTTTANTSADSANYVFGNEFQNYTLHKGDLVIIQHSDAGGGAPSSSPGAIKFSFIQRNIPDDGIPTTQFVEDAVAVAKEYLKMKVNDTGTNLLYLTGLMEVPDAESSDPTDIERKALTGYNLDDDENYLKDLLEGTHADVYDRYGQRITKARFLYTLTKFGEAEDHNGTAIGAPTGVNANTINSDPEATGQALWDALVVRQNAKIHVDDQTSILPHEEPQYHNLALTCAYLQHQVNVLGRQMYLLTDNDEGFPDTVEGRSTILENFRSGVTGPGAETPNGSERGDDDDASINSDGQLPSP